MNELYELKERLCDELKEYGKREVSNGSLDTVDKLTRTIKNLDKIMESDYSQYDGISHRRRDSMGRYTSRGYSYNGNMVSELRGMMEDAPDERTKQEFKRFIQKIESM